jgi:hypothetical protein
MCSKYVVNKDFFLKVTFLNANETKRNETFCYFAYFCNVKMPAGVSEEVVSFSFPSTHEIIYT